MKRRALFAVVLAAVLCGGCQMPQLTQQQIDGLADTVQQLQQVYTQLEPYLPAIQEAAQQLLKDEAVGSGGEIHGNDRSSQWRAVRDRYAAAHPLCEFCGRGGVDVHHILPFHLFPARELDPDNLVALCRVHHFVYGHAGDWKAYNPDVLVDKEFWRAVRATTPGAVKP